MTTGQIGALILEQVDDPTGAGFAPATGGNTTPPEVVAAINEGQAFASLLTLFCEKTANFLLGSNHSIDPNGCWYLPRPQLTDFLLPLRFTLGGARLRPATMSDVEMQDAAWQSMPGTPAAYVDLGFNLLAITPQGSGTASMTYAAVPPAVVNDADVPALYEAYHQNLVDYGVYRVRLKEGAQGLARGLERLNRFFDDMQKLGDWMRARTAAAKYDNQPFELKLAQRSGLINQIVAAQTKGISSQAALWRRRLQTEKY